LLRLKTPKDNSDGFTLIEALVALGVMAAGLAAVGGLVSSNLRASLLVQRHLAHIEAVRMILTGLPDRDALPSGRLMGSLDGHDWRVDSRALDKARASAWTPQEISLLVRSPSGAAIEIDTIRLGRRAAP
jgi:general secretion pathway protein I